MGKTVMIEADGVFAGGGVKGIGHVGALKRAEEEGVVFERVAGTSAGSIVAALYAAGYSTDELYSILKETDFRQFLDNGKAIDNNFWAKMKNFFVMAFKIFFKFGIYKGDAFYSWMSEKLKVKGVSKFGDLAKQRKKPLRVVALDLSSKCMVVFTDKDYADTEIAKAVRMSMSIPLFFYGYRWKDPKLNTNFESVFVDGGLLNNFPIDVFDDIPDRPTFGFKFVQPESENKPEPINEGVTYLKALVNTVMEVSEKIHVEDADWAWTIGIPTGNIGTTQFDLSNEQKERLYNSGYEACKKFFEEWRETKPTPRTGKKR